jgi:hypothetical protein
MIAILSGSWKIDEYLSADNHAVNNRRFFTMHSLGKVILRSAGAFFLLITVTVLQAEAQAADQHNHTHNGHTAPVLSLDDGNKWQTDAPLRKGMENINEEVMQSVTAYHNESLTKADAEKLSKNINEQVAYIVENCKLEPQADAVLHILIGDLLTAAGHLASDPLSDQGLPAIVKTLHTYPVYFEHQGWND